LGVLYRPYNWELDEEEEGEVVNQPKFSSFKFHFMLKRVVKPLW